MEKCFIESTATIDELNRRIQILIKAEQNAITTTMRFKYKAQKEALNSFLDWVLDTPWKVKSTED